MKIFNIVLKSTYHKLIIVLDITMNSLACQEKNNLYCGFIFTGRGPYLLFMLYVVSQPLLLIQHWVLLLHQKWNLTLL